jgi:hypothetical protein
MATHWERRVTSDGLELADEATISGLTWRASSGSSLSSGIWQDPANQLLTVAATLAYWLNQNSCDLTI